jgi:hypothetical protein
LALFQGSCCDAPPPDFCFLCANGSADYQTDTVIPKSASNTISHTCEEAATFDRYLLDTSRPGDCAFASRVQSRAWCNCDRIEPVCTLECPDGNPPPNLELTEPIFGKTCLRFMYEFTTLKAEQCPNAAKELNFDAVAFCCPPSSGAEEAAHESSCSICPFGERLKDSVAVQTEFFGTVTCVELQTHASFLPSIAGACPAFMFGLDIREGQECCEHDPDAATLSPIMAPAGSPGDGDGVTNQGPAGDLFWLGLVVFSILPMVLVP